MDIDIEFKDQANAEGFLNNIVSQYYDRKQKTLVGGITNLEIRIIPPLVKQSGKTKREIREQMEKCDTAIRMKQIKDELAANPEKYKGQFIIDI